ncbi:MAG TPA: glycosyltransferase [Puia sp.]|nr:glycosyltransferase [Puia sp.]
MINEKTNKETLATKKILWLASWYPNTYEPVNGDFIQRHAKAVSAYISVDVIHVIQMGKDAPVKDESTQTQTGALREFIYGFSFKRSGMGWLDKIRYNRYYQRFYVRVLLAYEKNYGRPDLLHVHVPMKAGLAAQHMKKIWQIPYIVSEQSSHYEKAAADSFYRRSFFFRHNTRAIFRGAKQVTNVSGNIGKILRNLFELKSVLTVHNMVDTDIFSPLPLPPPRIFRWLHVSSLKDQKNPEGMMEAFYQLDKIRQDWELVIVGPHTNNHTKLANLRGLSGKISFTGELPYEAVALEMQKASAFVLFSNHENFSCAVVEALCMGLPVVASRTGGMDEAVNESNGKLVPSGNIEALTAAINDIMNHYEEYDSALIAAAAKKKYSQKVIGEQFYSIYQQVLGGGGLT